MRGIRRKRMFGRDDLKDVRDALKQADCDKAEFKLWQKKYEKLAKQMPSVRGQYENARAAVVRVEAIVQDLVERIVQKQISDRSDKRIFADGLKELKKMQNSVDHEFLISRDDKEFHSTYDSILRLGIGALEPSDQRLILQSEMENLLDLLREHMDKEQPSFLELAFFYQEHSDRELVNLPHSKRIQKIQDIYRNDFLRPIENLMLEAMPPEQARQMEAEILRRIQLC